MVCRLYLLLHQIHIQLSGLDPSSSSDVRFGLHDASRIGAVLFFILVP